MEQVKAACGACFHFSEEIEKHLIMHFPEVKAASIASALIVEARRSTAVSSSSA